MQITVVSGVGNDNVQVDFANAAETTPNSSDVTSGIQVDAESNNVSSVNKNTHYFESI